jgi:hypothetical protein
MGSKLPALFLYVAAIACAQSESSSEDLLARVARIVNANLDRLPDYACRQTVERFGRFGSEKPWQRIDTLQLEVGVSGDREMYSWAGAREFQQSQLSELVGKGVIGTGNFSMLARHVFLPNAGKFKYKGQNEIDGREAHEWDFDIPLERSRYRLRTAASEAVVAFQGTVFADPVTLRLLRIEIHAYDLPEKLALAEAANSIHYDPVKIGDWEIMLPTYSELTLVATDGNESMNRLKVGDCRQFRGEAKVSFAGEQKEKPAEAPVAEPVRRAVQIPRAAVIEMELAEPIQPASAAVGQPVRVRLARAIKNGEQIVVPEGSEVAARLVRVEREDLPYPLWQVGIEIDSVRGPSEDIDLSVTLIDAGPESGLVRQSKTFMPTFTKRRATRMDILVRETPKGQGILHWDAKRPQIPKGLRMKWRTE